MKQRARPDALVGTPLDTDPVQSSLGQRLHTLFHHSAHKRHETNQLIIISVVSFFILTSIAFYAIPNLKLDKPLDELYLQMVIFLFATLVGFTISRQNSRYRQIIEELTAFDGAVTAIYREFGTFGTNYQRDFEQIARNYYEPIIEHRAWDYNLVNKSRTLKDTYALVDGITTDHELSDIEKMSAGEIRKLLADMQKNRKDLIALHHERVQDFQWFVIYFLCLILIITVFSVSSYGLMLESILKAAFVTTVTATAILLRRLDSLDLFESFIGENSARDVLEIFDGTK